MVVPDNHRPLSGGIFVSGPSQVSNVTGSVVKIPAADYTAVHVASITTGAQVSRIQLGKSSKSIERMLKGP
jgi:hypothetical protein